MHRVTRTWVLLLLCLMNVPGEFGNAYAQESDAGASPAGLIPVERLVAAREAEHFLLSPDGTRLAWRVADASGIRVMVKRIGDSRAEVFRTRTVSFRWAADSRMLLMMRDDGGDENHHVWVADSDNPRAPARDLTPGAGVKAHIVAVTGSDKQHIVVAHNRRHAQYADLYRIDLASGAESLLAENPGNVVQWLTDGTARLRGRITQAGDKRDLELAGDTDTAPWRRVMDWDSVADTVEVLGFSPDGGGLWLSSNRGRDRIALVRLDLVSGRETVVYADPVADLDVEENSVTIGPRSGQPLMAVSEPDYPSVKVFDARLRAALAPYFAQGPARIHLGSIDDAEQRATVDVYDGYGTKSYLLELDDGRASLLGEDGLSQLRDALAPVKPIAFTSRDGLTLQGYLTLPRDAANGAPLPLVVRVHGGPWYRNIWGNTDLAQAARQVQFLANRGYAVLEVNFRGSTGYGKHFTEMAAGEFAGAMQNDLLDGVAWAIRAGIADPRRVAMVGTSYGGYATLVALTDTPERFACGVAVSAPANLATLIESFPPDWALGMRIWHVYVGDPANPKDRAIMDRKSPIFRVGEIRRPLLLVHGENDSRVKLQQAQALADSLRLAGKPVDLLVIKGEGHFITYARSNLLLYRRMETFLAECIGSKP